MSALEAARKQRTFIKKVLIRGFKTYANQVDIDPFTSGTNVIVGRNGAGKSNFINAICFVLSSEKYFKMTSDERKSVLHKGPGETVLSGYVEIVFDNIGRVFPIDNNEVVIRRTVGLKKDEFYLDNKHVERDDILNLFEHIGFSRSNPYNIVMQGQVQALAMMSPAERLELVKEIAGARVYDDKRNESRKILLETAAKREKISSVIRSLDERIESLGEEKEELIKYQQLDRMRRALEYRLKESELDEVERQLHEFDASRHQITSDSTGVHSQIMEIESALETAERTLKSDHSELEQLIKEKSDLSREYAELLKESTRLVLEIQDAKGVSDKGRHERGELEKRLFSVQQEISKIQIELDQVNMEYEEALKQETSNKSDCEDKERRLKELYSKQGRTIQFKSKKDRDAFLKSEIKSLQLSIEQKRKQSTSLNADVTSLMNTISEYEKKIVNREQTKSDLTKALEAANLDYSKDKEKRDQLADRRKDLWKELKDSEEKLFELKNELLRVERNLESSMNKELSSGVEAVRRMMRERVLPARNHIYGTLMELMEVEPDYFTAVEVTAGNALFHIVVDTDETAALVLRQLNHERSGRVTCIPLNKVAGKNVVGELGAIDGVQGLPSLIESDALFRPAIHQIFGKTLVCASLDVGARVAFQHKVSCVTLDGDQVNTKGALTGGFHDSRTSRLRCMTDIKAYKKDISTLENRIIELKTNVDQLDQRITQQIDAMAAQQKKRSQAAFEFDAFVSSSKTAQNDLFSSKDVLAKRRQALQDNDHAISVLQGSIKALEDELSSDFADQLSTEEKLELSELNDSVEHLSNSISELTLKRVSIEERKNEFENSLRSRLIPMKSDLEAQLASLTVAPLLINTANMAPSGSTQLSSMEALANEQKKIEARKNQVEQKEKAADHQISEIKTRIEGRTTDIEKQKTQLSKLNALMANESKKLEKLLNSRASVLTKKDELVKRIREIGSLPTSTLEEVSEYTKNQCIQELSSIKSKLGKYAHVNKKALDQFMSFSEEKEKFTARQQQMEQESDAISRLIDTLDLQKEEAIARTFRGVAEAFSNVFSEMSPGGTGKLIMKLSQTLEEVTQSQTQSQQESSSKKAEQYTGIDMSVSFNNQVSTGNENVQLSGGQQSIAALALIFAIQRCDPAPFYIFDEIDPALDDRHRLAVAQMIQRQSKATQFIVTTHRPELINNCDKTYKISFENKVSNIYTVSKEEALEVVAASEQDPEMGERTSKKGAKPPQKKKKTEEVDDERVVSSIPQTEDLQESGDESSEEEIPSPTKSSRRKRPRTASE